VSLNRSRHDPYDLFSALACLGNTGATRQSFVDGVTLDVAKGGLTSFADYRMTGVTIGMCLRWQYVYAVTCI